jgi:hypothetical protein
MSSSRKVDTKVAAESFSRIARPIVCKAVSKAGRLLDLWSPKEDRGWANMFRQMDLKGKVKDDTQLNTVHQNTVSTIRAYEVAGDAVKKFSSKSPGP